MVSTDYEFVPMTSADLPLIRRWLETPHVAEWWHDAAEQFELVSGDLDHPDMAQFIVASDGRPFAYLQCYNLSDWNTGFGPQPMAPAVWISSSARRTCWVVATAPHSFAVYGAPAGERHPARGYRSRPGQCARDTGL